MPETNSSQLRPFLGLAPGWREQDTLLKVLLPTQGQPLLGDCLMGHKSLAPSFQFGTTVQGHPRSWAFVGTTSSFIFSLCQFRFLYFPTQRSILRALPLPNKLSVDKPVSDFASLETRLLLVGTKSDESQTKSYVWKPEGLHTKRLVCSWRAKKLRNRPRFNYGSGRTPEDIGFSALTGLLCHR